MLRNIEKSKDVANKPRVAPRDACCPTCLTQILARKSSRDEINAASGLQISHVCNQPALGEARSEDSSSASIDLTKDFAMMAAQVQAPLDAANARKQARDRQAG